jgi:hypothetical protein
VQHWVIFSIPMPALGVQSVDPHFKTAGAPADPADPADPAAPSETFAWVF